MAIEQKQGNTDESKFDYTYNLTHALHIVRNLTNSDKPIQVWTERQLEIKLSLKNEGSDNNKPENV